MKNYRTKEEFESYKANLEKRIDELEASLDFSPQSVIKSINPFSNKLTPAAPNKLARSVLRNPVTSLLVSKLLGKKYKFAANTLISITETGAATLMKNIEQSNFLEKILDRIIYATELNAAEERLLQAVEIEDEIVEIEEKIKAKFV